MSETDSRAVVINTDNLKVLVKLSLLSAGNRTTSWWVLISIYMYAEEQVN